MKLIRGLKFDVKTLTGAMCSARREQLFESSRQRLGVQCSPYADGWYPKGEQITVNEQ